MVKDAKNLLLAGVGAAALTYDKATEAISQLVDRGKLTLEEGKELSEELRRDACVKVNETKESVMEKAANIKPLSKEDLIITLREMNYATKADIIELKRMIEEIKEKI